jgi:Ca-activated chloride channel family protein
MNAYRFENPGILFALLLIPALVFWRRRRGWTPLYLVPYAAAWTSNQGRGNAVRRIVGVYAALALLIIGAARPQRIDDRQEAISRGYDLMLAVDLSTSMLAEDYVGPKGPINRLDAIRPVMQAFIAGRTGDRIGVVAFAGRAYTLSPLTTDHRWLQQQVADLKIGAIEDGTAIGDGLGIALTHLEAGRPEERAVGAFVVLLTDGANTGGVLTPPQATAIARHRRVPVYTIGAGRDGLVPYPVFDNSGRRSGTRQLPFGTDEDTLRTIAAATGGRYFKADDAAAVRSAFTAIDAAQKTRFRAKTFLVTTELFAWPVLAALACLLYAVPGLWVWRTDSLRAAVP